MTDYAAADMFTPSQARNYLVACCWWDRAAANELTDSDAVKTAYREYILRIATNFR